MVKFSLCIDICASSAYVINVLKIKQIFVSLLQNTYVGQINFDEWTLCDSLCFIIFHKRFMSELLTTVCVLYP